MEPNTICYVAIWKPLYFSYPPLSSYIICSDGVDDEIAEQSRWVPPLAREGERGTNAAAAAAAEADEEDKAMVAIKTNLWLFLSGQRIVCLSASSRPIFAIERRAMLMDGKESLCERGLRCKEPKEKRREYVPIISRACLRPIKNR